jgi:hypothetical protein
MDETFDKWLNRLILILLGVLIVLSVLKGLDEPPKRRWYQGMPDANGLISLMNTPCYQLNERLAYLRACVREERDTPPDETDCPAEMPSGMTYEPNTTTMAELLIKQLEDRQTSYACVGFNTDITLNDPAKTGVLDPENPDASWAKHQKQILDQLEKSREITEQLKEEANDQN